MEIYRGRLTPDDYDEYIDFINYVFGMNGHDISFPKVLPKLYLENCDPCGNSFAVKENGKLKAGVGSFPLNLSVAGEKLLAFGVGNVAVHPNCRGKGYMKDIMKMALDDMLANNADYSFLSGLRQRYNYFSYELCGESISFSVSKTNIRHFFGNRKSLLVLKPFETEHLVYIEEFLNKKTFHAERTDFSEFLKTWETHTFVAFSGNDFAGYVSFSKDNTSIHEFNAKPEFITDLIISSIEVSGAEQVNFSFPKFDSEYISVIEKFAETCVINPSVCFSVFNFKNVLNAFLKLKSTYQKLADGKIVVLIDGFRTKERLEISVFNNNVSVLPSTEKADFKFSHLEAMNFFFGSICEKRNQISLNWFPLPIYSYPLDNV